MKTGYPILLRKPYFGSFDNTINIYGHGYADLTDRILTFRAVYAFPEIFSNVHFRLCGNINLINQNCFYMLDHLRTINPNGLR